jgi:hypothetical protein
MALKIKWNDDRVRDATTAVLLIARDRLSRGKTTDLVRAALAEYRTDPKAYAANRATWAAAREPGPLTKPAHLQTFQNLIAAIDKLVAKATQSKRRFSSLEDLDHWLITGLPTH